MSKDKISTQEIAELLTQKAGISKKAADDFIKQLFVTIEDNLLAGEQVKIKNLGTFKLQWNEPRKSVNVQTGEEIILAGYNKVSFTPDAGLKDLVNEPYAHLEPVVLDENNEPEQPETPEPESETLPDPLRIFTEQANEIKDILSEIQSLSAEHKATLNENVEEETEEATVADIVLNTETYDAEDLLNEDDEMVAEAENIQLQEDEKDEDEEEDILSVQPTEDLSKFEEAVPEIMIETPENKVTEPTETTDKREEVSEKTPVEQEKAPVTETVTEPQNIAMTETTEYAAVIPPVKTRKRKPFFKRVWVWLFIVLLILAGSTIAVYFSSSCISCWFEYKVLNQTQRGKFQKVTNTLEAYYLDVKSLFVTEQKDSVTLAPDTVIVQKLPEADTLPKVVAPEKTVAPVDSLNILLNKPRVYTEFIGSERIVEGSRLTRIAERYYGTRDFWVYIYEANKEHIKNPDMIPIGTLIKIPKVDARLLDAQNPKVMTKARELHDLYVGKKQAE